MNKFECWVAETPGLGNRKKIQMLEQMGDAKTVYEAKISVLEALVCSEKKNKKLLSKGNLDAINEHKRKNYPEKIMEKLEKKKINLVLYGGKNYPNRIRQIPDPPFQLYYKGHLPCEDYYSAGLIGARECTQYGKIIAHRLGKQLGEKKIAVISGMAKGIDGVGQWACMEAGGESFAILGNGVDICYPKENEVLFKRLIQNGGLISEYAPGTQPRPCLFPPRNRIISAFSDVLIVVEAKEKSGTLITVEMALEQGKDVFVIPGRITDGISVGCNRLIKEGAGIIVSIEEFISEFFGIKEEQPLNIKKELTKAETIVYEKIDYYPICCDCIFEDMLEYSKEEIFTILLQLQLKGYIRNISGNWYERR